MQYSYSTDLTGKVALVTGAARGIGRACALALAFVFELTGFIPYHRDHINDRWRLDGSIRSYHIS